MTSLAELLKRVRPQASTPVGVETADLGGLSRFARGRRLTLGERAGPALELLGVRM